MRPLIILCALAMAGCGQKDASPEALCRDVITDKYGTLTLASAQYDSGGGSLTFDAPQSRLTCEVNQGKVVEATSNGEIIYQDLK